MKKKKKKKKKNNKEFLKLEANERPLFRNYKRIHKSKKDKMNSRQNRKKALKDELKGE